MSPVGHARGSTTEGCRALDRKLETFRVSSTTSDHTKLAACLDCLRCGDVLIALDLDRLETPRQRVSAPTTTSSASAASDSAASIRPYTMTPTGRTFLAAGTHAGTYRYFVGRRQFSPKMSAAKLFATRTADP